VIYLDLEIGRFIREIRKNKGYSQKYLINNLMTQSAYSKFELEKTDIRTTTFINILDHLEMSLEEFEYIKNNYRFNQRKSIINSFFNLVYNDKDELQKLVREINEYLNGRQDILLTDIWIVCNSLLLLIDTKDFKQASIPANKVWERLSKRNQLYITDIYLLNSIYFIFPLETALEMKNFIDKSIDYYKDFKDVQRLKINMYFNLSLLLINKGRYQEALKEINAIEQHCREQKAYIQLAIGYIRKGICLNRLGDSGEQWIDKGKGLLLSIEEFSILKVIEDELKRYNEKPY